MRFLHHLVANIWANHHYVATAAEASAIAILAGTDIDSGYLPLDSIVYSLTVI